MIVREAITNLELNLGYTSKYSNLISRTQPWDIIHDIPN
jgi:hypothetical protein